MYCLLTHYSSTRGKQLGLVPLGSSMFDVTERPVNKYHGQFKMTSEEYSEALADVTTSAYKILAAAVRTEVCV